VRESDAYLRDGKVRGRRKVFLLLYHLSGKAYDFYVQKAAINEEHWTVRGTSFRPRPAPAADPALLGQLQMPARPELAGDPKLLYYNNNYYLIHT
jgi:hypothetical protein